MGSILRFRFFLFPLFSVSTALVSGRASAQFLGQESLSESSYVIDQSGNLWAWGSNDYGQLGIGDRHDRDTPVMVPIPAGATRWTLVAAGPNFALALADSDKLYAWGLNDKGQIGIGLAGGLYGAPVRVPNPPTTSKWKWVSCGRDHCEALTVDGRLFGWGDNEEGQLGPGNTKYLVSPEVDEFPTGVTAWADVAAGPGYTLMISQSGLLYGCGQDSLGSFPPNDGPTLVRPDTFRAYSPLCCLAASDSLEPRIDETFSPNDYGYFDTTDDGGVVATIAEVACGKAHQLSLEDDGEIAASGDNYYGELTFTFFGKIDTFHTQQVAFPSGVTQFIAVAGGLHHSLAIANDGWLYSWGDDSLGELGIGNMPNQGYARKVMQVCPPLSMSAYFTAARNASSPYPIGLTVENTGSSPLTNASAFLLTGVDVTYDQTTPEHLLQTSLPAKDSVGTFWNTTIGEELLLDSIFDPPYFCYIQAKGSAPLLLASQPEYIQYPWKRCNSVNVVDSETHAPIANAELIFPGPPPFPCDEFFYPYGKPAFDSNKMLSDSDGIFTVCANGPIYNFDGMLTTYPINIARENYNSQLGLYPEPFVLQITYQLGPSGILGTFSAPATAQTVDSILKVYYPDSIVGYAISRNIIFRTRDDGVIWNAMYESPTTLHDIKFLDVAHGWAVGDSGIVLATTDTGESWQRAPLLTSHALRALAMRNLDTLWAVGDSGTVLEHAGTAWNLISGFQNDNLAGIHFGDPAHGAMVGNGVYYLYTNGVWTRKIIHANLDAVYYRSPGRMFFGGTNGTIITYNDQNLVCAIAGFQIIDTITFDSTYTTQTIHSLYFIGPSIGFAAGDSGASFVTYDGSQSWASMYEFPHTATSVNFFSLTGHAAMDNAVLNYDGHANSHSGIVRGRITYGWPPEPILGAVAYRVYESDSFTYVIDTTYSTDQGNFFFAGIDSIFPYEYVIHFTDSGIEKTHTFQNVKARDGEIVTLDYNDYTPPVTPPPDTNLSVNPSMDDSLSLNISASEAFAHILYTVPEAGTARMVVQDILGRIVQTVANGFVPAGAQSVEIPLSTLTDGAYYITLTTAAGTATRKFELIH